MSPGPCIFVPLRIFLLADGKELWGVIFFFFFHSPFFSLWSAFLWTPPLGSLSFHSRDQSWLIFFPHRDSIYDLFILWIGNSTPQSSVLLIRWPRLARCRSVVIFGDIASPPPWSRSLPTVTSLTLSWTTPFPPFEGVTLFLLLILQIFFLSWFLTVRMLPFSPLLLLPRRLFEGKGELPPLPAVATIGFLLASSGRYSLF